MVNLDDAGACSLRDPMIAASEEARRVATAPPPNRSATLARVIEADVIPRLLLANGRPAEFNSAAVLEVDAQDIDGFARMMIDLELTRAGIVVSKAAAAGVSLESILLRLFSPAAKRLGEMWEEDECSFTDVTVGLCALQSLLRTLASGESIEPSSLLDHRALIAAAPGEQHTFGILMIETFFRRAGWDVVGMPLAAPEEIIACVRRRMFSVVGFSLAREDAADKLRDLIADVRSTSMNRDIVVMVGGRAFNESPELVKAVGADTTATDADQALIAPHHLLCSRV